MRTLRTVLAVLCLHAWGPQILAESELEVSRLEAIHTVEIHTGKPASAVIVDQGPTGTSYRVEIKGGGTARVDAHHGRLLELRDARGREQYVWPGIRVVAHRGGVSLGPPENTLPAISRAIAVGADLIEVHRHPIGK